MSGNGSPKRSFDVTIVLLGVFLLGIANLWQLQGLRRQADLLTELGSTISPGIRIVFAAFWSLYFLASAALLWRRRSVARWLIPGGIVAYAIYNGVLLFWFVQSPLTRDGWPLDLLLYLGALLLVTWSLHRPGNRAFFLTP